MAGRQIFRAVVVRWMVPVIVSACTATSNSGNPAPLVQPTSPIDSARVAPTGQPSPTPVTTSIDQPVDQPPADDVHAVMLRTIADQRPSLAIDLHRDRLDGSWILDGTVDDGFGPGRLYVVVTPRQGDLTARPCGDPDFRQGGRCVERVLPDGDLLVLRDPVTAGGVTTVIAVLIHADRSGITAEASNQAIVFPPDPVLRHDDEPPPAL